MIPLGVFSMYVFYAMLSFFFFFWNPSWKYRNVRQTGGGWEGKLDLFLNVLEEPESAESAALAWVSVWASYQCPSLCLSVLCNVWKQDYLLFSPVKHLLRERGWRSFCQNWRAVVIALREKRSWFFSLITNDQISTVLMIFLTEGDETWSIPKTLWLVNSEPAVYHRLRSDQFLPVDVELSKPCWSSASLDFRHHWELKNSNQGRTTFLFSAFLKSAAEHFWCKLVDIDHIYL